MKTKINILILTLGISCGSDEDLLKVNMTKYSTLDDASRETDLSLETNLDSFSQLELDNMLHILKTRNSEEARQLKMLRYINREFCKKLSNVIEQCTAIAPITSSTYDKLSCTSNNSKNRITVETDGNYKLIADGLYVSNQFGGNQTDINFSSKTGSKDIDLRFIDITELRLLPLSGSKPVPDKFELKVNGVTLFNTTDLETDNTVVKIKLLKLIRLSKSEECNIPRSTLDQIRNKSRSEI